MLVAKSAERAREKSPRPRFGHWEASTDLGEGGGAGAEAGLSEPRHGGKRWAGAWPGQGVFLRTEEEWAPFWTGTAQAEDRTMQRSPGGPAGGPSRPAGVSLCPPVSGMSCEDDHHVSYMFLGEETPDREHHTTVDEPSVKQPDPGFDSVIGRGHTEPRESHKTEQA